MWEDPRGKGGPPLSSRAPRFRQSIEKKIAVVETRRRLDDNPASGAFRAKKGALSCVMLCLIYFDPQKSLTRAPKRRRSSPRSAPTTQSSRRAATWSSAEALTLPAEAITVRVRDGKMSTTDGPFMETKEVLGGFVLVEARDLNEAMRLAADIPFAKLGSIEVRPLVDFSKPPQAVSKPTARDAWRRSTAPSAPRAGDADPPPRRFRRGGGGAHDAFAAAPSNGRATASPPTRAPGWSPRAASRRSTLAPAKRGFDAAATISRRDTARRGAADARRRRTSVEDDRLRLIFTCCHPALRARRAGRADAARGRRPDDRRDRARVPRPRADDRAAHRAREGEDPRRGDPLRIPAARGAPGAPRERAAGRLSGLQRRLRSDRRARS